MSASKLANADQSMVSETSKQVQNRYGAWMIDKSLLGLRSFIEPFRRILTLSLYEKIAVSVVLALVVFAWTLDSVLHPRVENTDLNTVAVMVAKDLNPTLFPTDFTFSDSSFYQAYTPLYRWVVARLWLLTGNFELGLAWLVPGVLTVYLVGMFVLLYQVTGNPWLALGLTVASAHYHDMIGAEVWGIGGSQQIMARALFMAVVPYMALWFFYILPRVTFVQVALLGLIVGLAANLHPTSAMHLTVLLAATLILTHGFRREGWRMWVMLVPMMITTLLGAWPIFGRVTGNFKEETPAGVSFETFTEAVGYRYSLYFYPASYKWYGLELVRPTLDLLAWLYAGLALVGFVLYLWICWRSLYRAGWLRWAWLGGGLITLGYAYLIAYFEMGLLFGLVGIYIIYRFARDNVGPLDWLLLGMMGAVVLQSFVGYYLGIIIWQTFELQTLTSVFLEQSRSGRFIYLPVYILAGLASVALVAELEILISRLVRNSAGAPDESTSGLKTRLSVTVGFLLALLPGLPRLLELKNSLPITILLIIIGGLIWVMPGILKGQMQRRPWLPISVGILIMVSVLFGPLASVFSPILSIPAVNLLHPTHRVPNPPWPESDSQLYAWVRQYTPSDALFFWCDFGPSTTLRFRREAQRGITHNWKDLGWAVYDGTTLAPLLERYRNLEQACTDTSFALVVAYEVGADYILVPTAKAAELKSASCFINDRYIVFGLGPNACE